MYSQISERSAEISLLVMKVSLPVELSVQHNQNCDTRRHLLSIPVVRRA